MSNLNKLFFKSNLTRSILVVSVFFLFISNSLCSQENNIKTLPKVEQYSDSSAQVLKLIYDASLKKTDTLKAIVTLQKLALIYSHNGDHKESYEKLWQALSLADASNMNDKKTLVYRDIGRHYSYYKRKEKALKFLNLSLRLRKKLVEAKKEKDEVFVNSYLAFVATYREFNDFKLAKIYLDSSAVFLKESTILRDKSFYSFENGVILNNQKKYKEAIKEFETSAIWFSKEIPAYQVLINTYVGDSYKSLKNYKNGENYYLSALNLSKVYNAHKDFTPLIYERLSNLYLKAGNKDKAFKSLKISKDLDAFYFDSRSVTNHSLLEIQDEFLEEKK
jgi:tetratricopeptide (TPR) repeat protein